MQLTQRNAIFSYYLNLDAEYNHLPFSLRTVFFWGGGVGALLRALCVYREEWGRKGKKTKMKNKQQKTSNQNYNNLQLALYLVSTIKIYYHAKSSNNSNKKIRQG